MLDVLVTLILVVFLWTRYTIPPMLPPPSKFPLVFLLWAVEIALVSFAPVAMFIWYFPALVIMWLYAGKESSRWPFGVRRISLGWILGSVAMGAAVALPSLIFLGVEDEGLGVIALLFLGLVAPLYEELLYRRLMVPIFHERLGSTWALLLAAAAFTVTHLPGKLATDQSFVLLLHVFVVGVLSGQLFLRTGSIFSSLAFHMTYNSLQVVWPWLS